MTFGKDLQCILLQKYKILPKRRKKTRVTLKVHDRNREGLNMFR